jgi:sugar/nucleoside kinase (ribokinase family)
MKLEVIGMGLAAVDHIFIDHDKQNNKEPQYMGSAGGGSVGNTLSFLGALGYKTGLIGVIGNDIQSEIIKQDLKSFGVQTGWLVQKGKAGQFRRSRQYFQIISEHNHTHRFELECPSCKMATDRSVVFTKKEITKDMIEAARNCRIIHIDRANDASISLARVTLQAGGLVSFDFSFDSFESTRSKAQELISIATIINVKSSTFNNFIRRNKIETLEAFSKKFENIRLLVVTDGERGVYGFIRGSKMEIEKFKYPGVECMRLCDTSGAGDILIGTILAQLLNGSAQLELGFEKQMLAISQGIASIKCCFYGARSYSRILSINKTTVAEIFTLGGETARTGHAFCPLPPTFGMPNNFKFPFRFESYDHCQICGAPTNTRKKQQPTVQSNGFGKRLAEAHLPMIESYSNACSMLSNSQLASSIESNPVLFVGSGGSFSAAVFGEQMIVSLRGNPALALPPYELRSISAPLNNMLPVLLSYGGENNDILYAFDRLRALKTKEGFIITGNPDSRLVKRARDCGWQTILVSTIKGSMGHVATIGYLATLSSLSAILSPNYIKDELEDFFKFDILRNISKAADFKARELCEKLDSKPSEYHFIGLGSGWARPALVDLESKIVEGGISTIECSELKNFTHGRYISAYRHRKDRVAIVIRCSPFEDLAEFLKKRLEKQMPVFELSTEKPSILGAIDLVIQSLYLAHHLGLKQGIDISNPKYPKEAKGMYSWTPKEPTASEFTISPANHQQQKKNLIQ